MTYLLRLALGREGYSDVYPLVLRCMPATIILAAQHHKRARSLTCSELAEDICEKLGDHLKRAIDSGVFLVVE